MKRTQNMIMGTKNGLLALALGGVLAMGGLPVASTAWAADGGAVEEKDPREVELPTIIMPISRNERLVNYLFVTFRMKLSPKADPWKIRDDAHYGRDALVRIVHKVDMTDPENLKDFDRSKIESDIIPAMEKVYGKGVIEKMWPEYLDSQKVAVR